jgi:glucose/arabinose dehydrogenase
MRRTLGITFIVMALTGFSVLAQDSPTATPEPTMDSTQAEATQAAAPADDAASRLVAPQGFTVNVYASGFNKPRLMTVGEDGSLYVAEQAGNQVSRLTDADGDGVAEKVDVIAENMPLAHSLEWHEGWLYVSEGNQIERIQDADGDGTFEGREVVTTNIPEAVHHVTRTVHFGPDGMMYVSTGSSSNNDPETDPRRAAILRFNPDGSIPADNPYATDSDPNRQPIWAEGLRNSIDFLFTADGKLWANHNGSDDLGNDVPPEKVVINVEKGKNYGWPYCYTPVLGVVPPDTKDVQDTRVPFGGRISSCDQSSPALFTDLAHSAPIGMTMYNATAFPEQYQGNIFEAYHGSWNSSQTRDCKVQMIVVKDGIPVSSEPFLTGFRANEQEFCGSAWGRPAGVTVGANGELFVSDDQNGNIYRVVYTG